MAFRNAMPGVIRKICLWCQGGSPKFVRECEHVLCPLHACRLIEEGEDAAVQDCIAAFCLACAGSPEAVADCSADVPIGAQPPCPAHAFRIPEAAPPAQQVGFLPGLGEVRVRPAASSSEAHAVEPGPLITQTVPAVLNPSRQEDLANMYSGRAPEALDI
ncbi:MAG: hypothetical protein Q7J24_08820 [Desulfomicrobium sp.]|nr:hypothetical protein [Desulfomicrobium sp.]MDP3430229.1 hypothetical protein [Desulfomicrobium sp.]